MIKELDKKMEIGILTMPVKENYGGIIQAAALYHFLEQEGHKPYLIMKKYDEGFMKRSLRYLLSHNPLASIFDYKSLTKREKQVFYLKQFIDEFFTAKTNVTYNCKDYVNSIKHLDAIVVGSDQVWRYGYIGSNYPYYFLDFVPNTMIKVAYAASFGTNVWEGDDTSVSRIEKLLKDFKGVSVRENSGVGLCKETFNFDEAVHVLDPTFLPSVSFYNELIDQKKIKKEVGLFSYVLDGSEYVEKVLNTLENNLKIDRTVIELTDYKTAVKPSLEEWLYHFREADFVVTDSFHGMVFSIIFNKQFICVGNKKRGLDRFTSLLSLLGLEDRLVLEYDDLKIKELMEVRIDYNLVEVKKNKLKTSSVNFLESMLINKK